MGSITVPIFEEVDLVSAVDKASKSYTQRNPLSQECHKESCSYMPGGNTRTVLHVSPFPLTIDSAASCHLVDVDGHTYVDFLGEYTAGIYGHNNRVIRDAIENALDDGWNYGGHCKMEGRLARVVCERFPAIELVRFVNSGTEANTMALATALAYTGRKKILLFSGGYHGGTICGKSYTGKRSINLPHEFLIGQYNGIEETREVLQSIEHDSLAAILVEPMMGSGGCINARPEFLQFLRDISTKYGALLIFDEVMTSRLAYHGYGHHLGFTADLTTLGKWVGGGMTFGAFGGRRDIMNMYDPRIGEISHPGTFNNNVFTMAAGIAGCQLLTKSKLQSLNALGDQMRIALSKIFDKYSITGQIPMAPLSEDEHLPTSSPRPPKMFVTGVGSLMTIHFGGPQRTDLQTLYYHHMIESGIYMAQRGFIALSVEITRAHVDKFLEATDLFCRQWQIVLRWSDKDEATSSPDTLSTGSHLYMAPLR